MANNLDATEFFKLPNKKRPNRKEVFLEKYSKGEPFTLVTGEQVIFVKNQTVINTIKKLTPDDRALYNSIMLKGIDNNMYKITQIKKTAEFGGGTGSGAGADLTAVTESGQCYVCAIAYNVCKRKITWDDLTVENFVKAHQYCDTTIKFDGVIEKSPTEWLQSYIDTANKLFENYKMPGTMKFHRGSPFVDTIYKAKKSVHTTDAKSTKPQAPGSFSDDKWNPADIWMTTLTSPPKLSSTTWSELNADIQKLAKDKKLLGVSLKKVEGTPKFEVYNDSSDLTKNYLYEGFRLAPTGTTGKYPPFFSSIDMYMKISGKEIQFRATSGEAMWQGEIKGASAAGGKIGGGNVNFFMKKHTGEEIFTGSEKTILNMTREKNFFDHFYSLYTKHFKAANLQGNPVSFEEFKHFAFMKQQESAGYLFSKYMNMRFLDIFLKQSQKVRNEIVTDFFRYASSNIDVSSYFVKIS